MKKRLLSLLLAAAVLVTPALAYGDGTGEAVYINTTELADGFTYTNAVSYDDDGRAESFTLETERGSSVYPIVMACDTIYGGFTVTEMIAYAESLGYNVVGAVNADFGESNGVPTGMVVENGVYKSSSEGNSAIAFNDGRAFVSEKPEVELTFTNEENGYEYTTEHLNKSRTDYGAYVFSEYFSTVSTRTSGDGWFVRFEVLGGDELTLGGEVELIVTEINTDGGSVSIGGDNLILTASDAAALGMVAESFEVGDRVTLEISCSDSRLEDADWVSGCGNILALDGEIYDQDRWNSEVTDSNPRTAIGIKSDGTVVYHVLDGRSSLSVGATLEELAQDMLSMGCVDVVNLDGGGSSVMSLRVPGIDGFTVVNDPSDGRLRSVSSYILFVTDSDPNGSAGRLFLAEDGDYVLAGSSVDITVVATDRALHTVAAPESVSARAQRGTVEGGVYTAPESAGTDSISLSGGGVSGSGTLHVIDRVDSLTVTDAATGNTVSQLMLENGESVDLDVAAKYLMRDVSLSDEAVEYTLTGDIGTITPDGVFTASLSGAAAGTISVSCGGVTQEISVRVAFEFTDMRGHWASEFVKELYEAGIVTGVTDAEFGPSLSMKRGDFVLMLYRAAGQPAVSGSAGFEDVAADAYYADAVAWAVANGITEGKGEGTFAPDDTLTRQEGFTFLYRALDVLGADFVEGDTALLDSFADGASVAEWARSATATLITNGVVEGSESGLNPTGSLTRAEMAKMLASVV